jgi:2-phospho-L-lactate/phosphoenolpyruvate guanylyltransferase
MGVWAVVPVKERDRAKERLAGILSPAKRQALTLAMLEDVLSALAGAPGLAGAIVVTVDQAARRLAQGYGVRIFEDGARDGHTGAVTAAARRLAAERETALLTLPGDVPLVTADEVGRIIAAHAPAPSFTIVPSHDEGGSNAIMLSPPEAVPLRFGVDSFYPHLGAATARGIHPTVLRLPGIALDIDNPADLGAFVRVRSQTRTRALLDETGLTASLLSSLPDVGASRGPSAFAGSKQGLDLADSRGKSGCGERGQEDFAR